MINNDRIVPVQKIDLLSLYATIIAIADEEQPLIIESEDVAGTFGADSDNNSMSSICNQPVKTLDIMDEMTGGSIYFVAAHDFEWVKYNDEVVVEPSNVITDAATLYKIVITGGEFASCNSVAPVV